MSVADYVPHGLVTAFAGVVAYVFKNHAKQDDDRYATLTTTLSSVAERQQSIADQMASNHAELLRVMLEGERNKNDAARS
jgi:hypothetical protein